MGLGESAAEISRKPYRLIFLYALAVRYFSLLEKSGSPGRIRTGDLSINSRMLYR